MTDSLHLMADPDQSHPTLTKVLDTVPFFSDILSDQNRVEDALDYRELLAELRTGPPSVLEVLWAFASRLYTNDYIVRSGPGWYFDQMLRSSGLIVYSDRNILSWYVEVDEILTKVDDILERRYSANGRGGFFPITQAHYSNGAIVTDVRSLGLWEQAMMWLEEVS